MIGGYVMVITCDSILKLPFLENMKVVAGERGLNRIIRWVHVMEYPEYSRWLNGGELILFSGVAIKNDLDKFLSFVKDINSKNVSGLAVNIGPYIEKTPKEVISLADSLGFPIFEFPFEVKFIDVSQSICKAIFINKVEQQSRDNFMKDIILKGTVFSEDILERAILYGYNPNREYYSFVISIENFNKIAMKNGVLDSEKAFQVKQHVEQIVMDMFNKKGKKLIQITEDSSIILMIEGRNNNFYKTSIEDVGWEIIKNINAAIDNITVNIGIGGLWNELKDFKKSVNEARKILRLLKANGLKNTARYYENIGIYKLFFKIDDYGIMENFYLNSLKSLLDYDNKNTTQLVDTLEVYIEEGGNLNRASEKLFVHKNTLKYRIKRIEEISKCDLRNVNQLFDFYISFKIKKFLKISHFNSNS